MLYTYDREEDGKGRQRGDGAEEAVGNKSVGKTLAILAAIPAYLQREYVLVLHLSPRRNSASREESAPVGRYAWVDSDAEGKREVEKVIVGRYTR